MKVLVFDTETTGLPSERNASIMDVNKWPYIIQLSYILFDTITKKVINMRDDLIKIPQNVIITPESEEIHHITHNMCEANGIYISDAINYFNKVLNHADIIIGHNISFDKKMLMVECMRSKTRQYFTVNGVRKPEYCTMKKNTELCQISVTNSNGETYFKYPTLSELHLHLFGTKPYGTHNAFTDVLICLRCYIKIVEHYDFMDSECYDLKNLYIEQTVLRT